MDIRIKLVLHRDSDNSFPSCVVLKSDDEYITLELGCPDRTIMVKKEELIKALAIL